MLLTADTVVCSSQAGFNLFMPLTICGIQRLGTDYYL